MGWETHSERCGEAWEDDLMTVRFGVVSALALAAVLAVAGCSTGNDASAPQGAAAESSEAAEAADVLSELGISTTNPREIINALDALPVAERPTNLIASVTPTELQLQPGESTAENLAIPEGEFYLSIAPYVEQTHPCTFHSLTTCLGEMGGADIELRIVNTATGEAVVDEARTIADNGFTGIWLKSGNEYEVTVTAGGKTGTQVVTTGPEDPTCLTTLQIG